MSERTEALGCILSNAVVIAGKELAENEATITRLADALDTACNLLARVGCLDIDHGGYCGNCSEPWDAEDPGHPDRHSAECDIPDVFRVRDEFKAAQERLEKEVGL